jgi:hypothetical protein
MRSGVRAGATGSSNDSTKFCNVSKKLLLSIQSGQGPKPLRFRFGRPFSSSSPYLVAFELHAESMLVLAVAHAKRQPLYWLARTSQRPG